MQQERPRSAEFSEKFLVCVLSAQQRDTNRRVLLNLQTLVSVCVLSMQPGGSDFLLSASGLRRTAAPRKHQFGARRSL
jgi:hypothetical protein